jgi:Flp pilus assembly protein TadD
LTTSSAKETASNTEDMRAFLEGSLRKDIGLKSSDLRIGLEVAKNFMKRGAFPEALRTYAALCLCEPANIDFQIGLANCTLQMEEYHLALQAASVVVALAPRNPRGYYMSGRACVGLGHLSEAREDLAEAIELGVRARDGLIVEEARKLLQAIPALSAHAGRRAALA